MESASHPHFAWLSKYFPPIYIIESSNPNGYLGKKGWKGSRLRRIEKVAQQVSEIFNVLKSGYKTPYFRVS